MTEYEWVGGPEDGSAVEAMDGLKWLDVDVVERLIPLAGALSPVKKTKRRCLVEHRNGKHYIMWGQPWA